MKERDLPGRVTQYSVPNVLTPVVTASLKRIKILFCCPNANAVAFSPESITAFGQGINLTAAGQPVEVVGDLARAAWNGFGSAAGPQTGVVIEYFAPDIGE